VASFSFSMRFRSSARSRFTVAEKACWDGAGGKLDRRKTLITDSVREDHLNGTDTPFLIL
jgi:hypothetical protein